MLITDFERGFIVLKAEVHIINVKDFSLRKV